MNETAKPLGAPAARRQFMRSRPAAGAPSRPFQRLRRD